MTNGFGQPAKCAIGELPHETEGFGAVPCAHCNRTGEQFMSRSRCFFYCAVAISTVAVASIWAAPGYLPSVGPAPLRFRAPAPPPSTNAVALPMPANPVPDPAPLATNSAKLPDVPASSSAPVPVVMAATNQPAAIGGSSVDEPIVSPQMLLKYFAKSTNGVTTGVIAPIGFTPPRATELPSSKASYSTTP